MVSKKQKAVLLKNGYSEQAISNMSYQQISQAIGEIMGRPKQPDKPEYNYNKPQTSEGKHTTMYVSYAKDIFVHLLSLGTKATDAKEIALSFVKVAKNELI